MHKAERSGKNVRKYINTRKQLQRRRDRWEWVFLMLKRLFSSLVGATWRRASASLSKAVCVYVCVLARKIGSPSAGWAKLHEAAPIAHLAK